jgi:hypothetical protein
MNAAMSRCWLVVVFSAAASMAALACGSDAAPAANVPTSVPAAQTAGAATAPAASAAPAAPAAPDACSQIAGVCHMHDGKGGAALIHECHELGHAHKLDACVARKQECLDACADHAH